MKAAVVGGGLAGLVAANELAAGGADVTLYERGSSLGGRASSDTFGESRLNRGPHALYRAGAGMPILKRLGVEPQGRPPSLHRFDVVIDGQIMRGPTTPWAMAAAGYMSLGEKMQLGRFLGALFRLDASQWDGRSIDELLDTYADTPVLRRILQMTTTIATFGRSPRFSAGTAIRQVRASLSNVLYLDEGWQSLVDALAARAVERGVQIVVGTRVDDVFELDADVVVLAVAPEVVEKMCGVDFGPRRPTQMATMDFVMPTPPSSPRNTFDVDRGIFLSFHPNGAGHCGMYLDPFVDRELSEVRGAIEDVLDLAQPGWREHVEHVRFLPQMNVNEWFPDFTDGGIRARPDERLDAHTFIAGDWVGDEGLLADAAIASASRAAKLALQTPREAAA